MLKHVIFQMVDVRYVTKACIVDVALQMIARTVLSITFKVMHVLCFCGMKAKTLEVILVGSPKIQMIISNGNAQLAITNGRPKQTTFVAQNRDALHVLDSFKVDAVLHQNANTAHLNAFYLMLELCNCGILRRILSMASIQKTLLLVQGKKFTGFAARKSVQIQNGFQPQTMSQTKKQAALHVHLIFLNGNSKSS